MPLDNSSPSPNSTGKWPRWADLTRGERKRALQAAFVQGLTNPDIASRHGARIWEISNAVSHFGLAWTRRGPEPITKTAQFIQTIPCRGCDLVHHWTIACPRCLGRSPFRAPEGPMIGASP